MTVIPGEHRGVSRDVREGDPGGMIEPSLTTWVPFPSRSVAALGRE